MSVKCPISCFIIAMNEADRIEATLKSVSGWVDEIIVIDSGSTDGTQDIARQYHAKVIENDWQGYGQQKQFGENQCRNDWLLNLDADEVLSPELAMEIRSLFAIGKPKAAFYKMRLKTVYPGEEKPRLWADYHNYIRLYDISQGRFAFSAAHDTVDPKGHKVIQLKEPAWHFSHRSLSHLIQKTDGYTNLQITTKNPKSRLYLLIRLFSEFPLQFIKYYFIRRHFTGGITGISHAVALAFSRFARIAKMLEQQKRTK